jgi:hypothetical protein
MEKNDTQKIKLPEVLKTDNNLWTSSSESFPSRSDRWNEPPLKGPKNLANTKYL